MQKVGKAFDTKRVSVPEIHESYAEISKFGALDMHKYLAGIKHDSENFSQKYNEYTHKYHIED